ncbi:MAG TPA: hypothetical protein DDW19_02200 [Anaerolineaceae bacterium]|nr:hypothetical protein [Anaerolineaceae bacterium]
MMWYYAINGQQMGPVDEARIKELLANGTISESTLVWTNGMSTWQPLAQVNLDRGSAQLQPAVSVTPPGLIDPQVNTLNKLFTWMWISLAASLITFGISLLATVTLFMIIVYKSWELVQDGHARTTPDQAVAFSFIPGFQFWWWFIAFKSLAKDLNRVMANEHIPGKPVSEDLALWFVISLLAAPLVFPLIATVVIGIILASQYRDAAASIILERKNTSS